MTASFMVGDIALIATVELRFERERKEHSPTRLP
jgi:hypothetical protein